MSGFGKYHKIQSIYKRDAEKDNKFIMGDWSTPELELLAEANWVFTEKIDGTNIRIHYDGKSVQFGGRTDAAAIPAHLIKILIERFTLENLNASFPEIEGSVTLYGEGYGHKIQSGGKYLANKAVDFVLFDVRVEEWWLKREDVDSIAKSLGVLSVPVIGKGTLHDAIAMVKSGLTSEWGDFEPEGIVARPAVDLFSRNGKRIITKIKAKDFK
jgi:hypothetical protein